jgi:hypothetical protein
VQVRQAYQGGELPADSEDDIVADEYEEATMRETQPQRAPLQRYVVRSWVRVLCVGCILVLVNCNIKVKPRLCMQARQLSMMSNEAAFQLHNCRNKGRGALDTFVHVSNTLKISYNVVRVKRLS